MASPSPSLSPLHLGFHLENRAPRHMADQQIRGSAAMAAAPSQRMSTATSSSMNSSAAEREDPEQEDALSAATAAAAAVSASGKKLMNAAPAQVKSLMSRFSTPFGRKKAASESVTKEVAAPPASTPARATTTTTTTKTVKVVEEAPKSAPVTVKEVSTEATTTVVTETTATSGEAATAAATEATAVVTEETVASGEASTTVVMEATTASEDVSTAVDTEATTVSAERSIAVVTEATVATSESEAVQEEVTMTTTTTQDVAQESVEMTTTTAVTSVEEAVDVPVAVKALEEVAVSVEVAAESAVSIAVNAAVEPIEAVQTVEEAANSITTSTTQANTEETVEATSSSATDTTTTAASTESEVSTTATATSVGESDATTAGSIVIEESASALEVTEELKISSDAATPAETKTSADATTTEEPTPSPVKISFVSADLQALTPVKEAAPATTIIPISPNAEIEVPTPSPFKDIRNRFEVKKEQSLDNLPFRTVRSFFSEEERSVRVGAERKKYNALTEQQTLDAKIADEMKGKVKSPIAEDVSVKRVVQTEGTGTEGSAQTEARPAKKDFSSIVSRFEGKKDQSLDNLPFRTVRNFFSEEERSVRVGAERKKYNALTEQQSQAKIADEKKKPKQKEEAVAETTSTDTIVAVETGVETTTTDALSVEEEVAVVPVEETQEIKAEEVAATTVITSEDSASTIAMINETVAETTTSIVTECKEVKAQDEAPVVAVNEENTSTDDDIVAVVEGGASATVEEIVTVEVQEASNEATVVATTEEGQDEKPVVTANEENTSTDDDIVAVVEGAASATVEVQEASNEATVVAATEDTASTLASEESNSVVAIEGALVTEEAIVVASVESFAAAEEIKTAEVVGDIQENMKEAEATVDLTSAEATVVDDDAEIVVATNQSTVETPRETEGTKTHIESVGSGTNDKIISFATVSEKKESVTTVEEATAKAVVEEPTSTKAPWTAAVEEPVSSASELAAVATEEAEDQKTQVDAEIDDGTIGTMQIFTQAELATITKTTDEDAVSQAVEAVIHTELLSESSTISVEQVESGTAVAVAEKHSAEVTDQSQVDISDDADDASGAEATISAIDAVSVELKAISTGAASVEIVDVESSSFATVASESVHSSSEVSAADVVAAVEVEVITETTEDHISEEQLITSTDILVSAKETEIADESVEVIAEIESAGFIANKDVTDAIITEATSRSVEVKVSPVAQETVEVEVEDAMIEVQAEEADTFVAATTEDEHCVLADELSFTEASAPSVVEMNSEITASGGAEIEVSEENDITTENEVSVDESTASITEELKTTASSEAEIETSEKNDSSAETDAAVDESTAFISEMVANIEVATQIESDVKETSTDESTTLKTVAQDGFSLLPVQHTHAALEVVTKTTFEAVAVEDFEVKAERSDAADFEHAAGAAVAESIIDSLAIEDLELESAERSADDNSESLEVDGETEIIATTAEVEHAAVELPPLMDRVHSELASTMVKEEMETIAIAAEEEHASAELIESARESLVFDEQVIDSALFTVAVSNAEILEVHTDVQEAEAVSIAMSAVVVDDATDGERDVSQNLSDAFDAVEDESGDEFDDIHEELQPLSVARDEAEVDAASEEDRTKFEATSSTTIETSEQSNNTVSEYFVKTSMTLEETPPASQDKRPMLTTERSFVMDDGDLIETEDTVVVGERFSTDGEEDVVSVSKVSRSTSGQAAGTKTMTIKERKLSVSRTKTNDAKSSTASATRSSKPQVDIAVRQTAPSVKRFAEAKPRPTPATTTVARKAVSSFGKIEPKPALQIDAPAPAAMIPRKAAVPVQPSPAPRRPSITASTASSAAKADNVKPDRAIARKSSDAPAISKPLRPRAATKTKPVDIVAPPTPAPARRAVLKQRSQSSDSRDITEVKKPEWKSNHARVQSRVNTGTAATSSKRNGNNQGSSPSEDPVVDRRKSISGATRKSSVSKPAKPSLVPNRRSSLTSRSSLSERPDFDNVGSRSGAREKREARIGSASSSSSSTDSPDPFALALEKSSRKPSRDGTIPRYLDYQNSPTYMRNFQQQLERRKRLEEINAMKSEERQKALRAYFVEKQHQTYQSQEEELRRGSEQHELTKLMKDKERAADRAQRREKSRARHARTAQTSSSDDTELSATKSMKFESNRVKEVSAELVVEREAELKTSIEDVSENNREVIEEEFAVLAETKQPASVGVDEVPEASP